LYFGLLMPHTEPMTDPDDGMGTLELEEDRRGFFRLSNTQHELIIQPEQLAALRNKIDEFLHTTDERTPHDHRRA
jgi:hypothetical protein